MSIVVKILETLKFASWFLMMLEPKFSCLRVRWYLSQKQTKFCPAISIKKKSVCSQARMGGCLKSGMSWRGCWRICKFPPGEQRPGTPVGEVWVTGAPIPIQLQLKGRVRKETDEINFCCLMPRRCVCVLRSKDKCFTQTISSPSSAQELYAALWEQSGQQPWWGLNAFESGFKVKFIEHFTLEKLRTGDFPKDCTENMIYWWYPLPARVHI